MKSNNARLRTLGRLGVVSALTTLAIAASPLAAQDAVTVNLWHTIPAETEVFWLEELLPTLQEANPQCNYVPRQLGVEDAAVIRQGLAAGGDDAPAMAWIASSETGAYVEAGLLADVQGWLDENPEIRDNIVPSLLELSSYDGEVRSLPWMTNNLAMWINVEAFEAAGVPVPSQDPETTWTWEEFASAVEQLTTEDQRGFLLATGNGGWVGWVQHAYLAQNGGEFLAPDGAPTFNNEAGVEAVAYLKDLYDAGYFATTNEPWLPGPWYAGEVAIHLNGPWNFPTLSTFEDFEFTVVPYPRGEQPATNLGGNQLFIFDRGEAINDCSFAYGEYMLSDEFQVAFQIQSGNLPVTTSAVESEEYQAHLEAYPYLAGWVNQVPYGVARLPVPQYADVTTFYGQAWQEIFLNDADIQSSLDQAAVQAEALQQQ